MVLRGFRGQLEKKSFDPAFQYEITNSILSHFVVSRDQILHYSMNAKELLQCAPRLSESNRAYVLFINGDRGIIVPPGACMRC